MECGWWEMSSTRGSAFPNIYRNGTLAWSTQHWKKNAQEYELAQMLVELLEQENYHITDVGLNSLVVHVAVAIQRIQSGQYIQMTEEENQRGLQAKAMSWRRNVQSALLNWPVYLTRNKRCATWRSTWPASRRARIL